MQAFLNRLMEAAKSAGIEAAEAYVVEQDSFSAMTNDGEITEYKSNTTRGMGFRGMKNGRMGYSSTEAFDDEAIGQLIKGVLESAELCEDTDVEFLYNGDEPLPELDLFNTELEKVTPEEKIACALEMEKITKAYDKRIEQVPYNMIQTGKHTIRIMNTHGLDRSYSENICALLNEATAKDDGFVSSGSYGLIKHSLDAGDAKRVAMEAASRAVYWLHAAPVPSGKYHVVFFNEVMTGLMSAFAGIFMADTAQKGLSLLAGKLDTKIAAPCVTLVDDPLLQEGLESRPFDAEGVPSKAHTVIDAGMFKTFLHNLKTAHKDGVKTTGNASKAGYASTVHVSPSNLYFQAGLKSFDEMLESIGNGIVITEVSGLHAGANAVSGDFSLLSKGYTFQNGKRGKPVEQITVAGNYYELLQNAREFANDLRFPDGGMGSPSADVGELSISGC
ncbi:MAG: TldD/PmbA family protein [Clostridia bacterium]